MIKIALSLGIIFHSLSIYSNEFSTNDLEFIKSQSMQSLCGNKDFIGKATDFFITTKSEDFNQLRKEMTALRMQYCSDEVSMPQPSAFKIILASQCKKKCKTVKHRGYGHVRTDCRKACDLYSMLLTSASSTAGSSARSFLESSKCQNSAPNEGAISDVPYSDPAVGVLYPETNVTTLDQYFGSPAATGRQ